MLLRFRRAHYRYHQHDKGILFGEAASESFRARLSRSWILRRLWELVQRVSETLATSLPQATVEIETARVHRVAGASEESIIPLIANNRCAKL